MTKLTVKVLSDRYVICGLPQNISNCIYFGVPVHKINAMEFKDGVPTYSLLGTIYMLCTGKHSDEPSTLIEIFEHMIQN